MVVGVNSFGHLLRLTTFGESHGPAVGAVVDGCPAGIPLAVERIQAALDRRRPGQSDLTTARNEGDRVEILSGVFEGKTLGTPIAALVRNVDARSADYERLKREDRPGHADAAWRAKFQHRDPRGGGRTSARETVGRVIGGAIAEAWLAVHAPATAITAYVGQVGPLRAPRPSPSLRRHDVDAHPSRCPDAATAAKIEALLLEAKARGDSYGGAVDLIVDAPPPSLGEPVFDKLKARLCSALASIGAVTGVIWGPYDDLTALEQPGSRFHQDPRAYGGIQGGISTGQPIELRVLFKPPATLGAHALSGRHDPCVLPRAVPIVEAMAALVLADLSLESLARPHRE